MRIMWNKRKLEKLEKLQKITASEPEGNYLQQFFFS